MAFVKADIKRCQAEKKIGCWPTAQLFMALGPPKLVRCPNKPRWIATEAKPQKGYKNRGSMSLCDDCKKVFLEAMGTKHATFKKLSP